MAQSTSDAFLSGQGIPVEPGEIESELIRLWGTAAERVGGPEMESPNVTRIVLANLVVEAGPECPECLEADLDTVVARYPCRSIVLRRTGEPGRKVEAEIAALCHLPSPDRPQVCSERIVLKAGPDAVDLFPGAVRPLLEANLPFVLWWTDDPRHVEGLFRDLAGECSRLVLDLPDPLDRSRGGPVRARPGGQPVTSRDTAWFGITRWRELVAQFFDGPDCADLILTRVASVEILAEVPGQAWPGFPGSPPGSSRGSPASLAGPRSTAGRSPPGSARSDLPALRTASPTFRRQDPVRGRGGRGGTPRCSGSSGSSLATTRTPDGPRDVPGDLARTRSQFAPGPSPRLLAELACAMPRVDPLPRAWRRRPGHRRPRILAPGPTVRRGHLPHALWLLGDGSSPRK